MRRDEIADMAAFVAVAEERSFTRAASRLNMSQSALSQIVRRLEGRLGVRLLIRTTRSVAPTEAGEQIVRTLSPVLMELDSGLSAIRERAGRPSGSFRITATDHAVRCYLIPGFAKLLPDHPEIHVEVAIDYGLADVVADRFDAGVRLGDAVDKDMIAVRISPPTEMVLVASPDYLARHTALSEPRDLHDHHCIGLRLPTSESLFPWTLTKGRHTTTIRPESQSAFNAIYPIIDAARSGLGIAFVPLDEVEGDFALQKLVHVLPDWTDMLQPYHLYYPARRSSRAFNLLVDALRWRN